MVQPSKDLSRAAARQPLPAPASFRWPVLLAVAVITLAALVAYHNSFAVPFLLDDDSSIKDNPTIHSLWRAWWPPTEYGVTVSGRPLLNFTLALNYAVTGRQVWSYHVLNLLIHVCAGLVLFGVVRRTLRQPSLAKRFGDDSLWLALSVALLWTVHPLQTESVTYVIQRAESLVGLMYLLTLWCFIRATEAEAARRWPWLTFLCCLLGMAAKEVMVTAPMLVALYDRIFVAGTWREVWVRRKKFHLALAGTWLLLAGLLISTGNRGGTAGLGTASSMDYALTQVGAVVHYLRLAFWPSPLVFDYGTVLRTEVAQVVPLACVLVPLALASLWAAWQGRPAGYCGLFFFGVLAPSSSIVPVLTQTIAEHRMYLPLAAVVALAVTGLYLVLGRKSGAVFLALTVALTVGTVRRNHDYRSVLAIWEDSVAKWPEGARAQSNLGGLLLSDPARQSEAIGHIEAAIRLSPRNPLFHISLGLALDGMPGRSAEAIAALENALKLDPNFPMGHAHLAAVLRKIPGREAEAVAHLRKAIGLKLETAFVHAALGQIMLDFPELREEAAVQLRAAIRMNPDDAESYANLGMLMHGWPGRESEAIQFLETAARLSPDNAGVRTNLGFALAADPGRITEAAKHFAVVVRLQPDSLDAHYNYGTALLRLAGREVETIEQFEAVLRLNPDDADAHNNLGLVLSRLPARTGEAQRHFETALRLKPELADAHFNLAKLAAAVPSRLSVAISQLEATLKLAPDHEPAKELLAQLRGQSMTAASLAAP